MSVIAIIDASSQITKDLIHSFATAGSMDLLLYSRDLNNTKAWVAEQKLEAV